MSEVIGIITSKGGVGKTTTAVNLAASLSLLDKKTLIVDFDPQSNATLGVGIKRSNTRESSVYDVMSNTKKISDIILKVEKMQNLYIAPANQHLASIQKEFYINPSSVRALLQRSINTIRDKFDYIIIDSPPTLGPIFSIVLNSVNSVIIPVQCEYLSLDGTAQLLTLVRNHKNYHNKRLTIRGFLPTMFTNRNKLSSDVLESLKEHAGIIFFEDDEGIVVIPRTVKLAECFGYSVPICIHDSKSPGHLAYMRLAHSLVKNCLGDMHGKKKSV